jgi:hypothetical protein
MEGLSRLRDARAAPIIAPLGFDAEEWLKNHDAEEWLKNHQQEN